MGAGHLPRRCRCFDYVPDSFPYAMPRRICESDECFPSGNGCQYRFPWSDYHYRGDSQWLLCSGGSFMGGIWTMKGEYYFSPSQVAFYPASLREVYEYAGCWPVDGEWVSAELHEQLMNEQAAGRAISSDVKGNPVAIERPPLSRQQRSAHERRWRDSQLLATDGLVVRHRDQWKPERKRPYSLSNTMNSCRTEPACGIGRKSLYFPTVADVRPYQIGSDVMSPPEPRLVRGFR